MGKGYTLICLARPTRIISKRITKPSNKEYDLSVDLEVYKVDVCV